MLLSKAIHSVLYKLLHKYYVMVGGVCEPPHFSNFEQFENGARGELLCEPAGICLGR